MIVYLAVRWKFEFKIKLSSSDILDRHNNLSWFHSLVIRKISKVPGVIFELLLKVIRFFNIELFYSKEIDFMLIQICS